MSVENYFQPNLVPDEKDAESVASEEKILTKEEVFSVLIMNGIIEDFDEDLYEAGFEYEEVQEFEREIESMDEEEIKGVLCLPKELRLRNFPRYLKEVRSGSKTIRQIISGISELSKQRGFTLGYHASNSEILQNGQEWTIEGREMDDRDNVMMAYYSLDYENIFRAHRFKYLYVVRAQVGVDTTHKRDTSNNWGRASTLSVVSKFDMAEIDEKVYQIIKAKKQEIEKEKAV